LPPERSVEASLHASILEHETAEQMMQKEQTVEEE